MVNVGDVLLLVVDAELTLDRPSVDRIRFLVDRPLKVLDHVMSLHEVWKNIRSIVQLIDAVQVAWRLRDHQVGIHLYRQREPLSMPN